MINQDKPDVGIPETYLNIGTGFNLLVGGLFRLIVGNAGASGMVNQTKGSQGLTWATIQTTWASELKTWLGVSQIIDNNSKPTTSITNFNKP